jgi:hypothetical protein
MFIWNLGFSRRALPVTPVTAVTSESAAFSPNKSVQCHRLYCLWGHHFCCHSPRRASLVPWCHALWSISSSSSFSTSSFILFVFSFLTTWITLRVDPVSVRYVESEVSQARKKSWTKKKQRNAKSIPLRGSCPHVLLGRPKDSVVWWGNRVLMEGGGKCYPNQTPLPIAVERMHRQLSGDIWLCYKSSSWSDLSSYPCPSHLSRDKCKTFVDPHRAAVTGMEHGLHYSTRWRISAEGVRE